MSSDKLCPLISSSVQPKPLRFHNRTDPGSYLNRPYFYRSYLLKGVVEGVWCSITQLEERPLPEEHRVRNP